MSNERLNVWLARIIVENFVAFVVVAFLGIFASTSFTIWGWIEEVNRNELERNHLTSITAGYEQGPTHLTAALSSAVGQGLDLNSMAEGAVSTLFSQAILENDARRVGAFLSHGINPDTPIIAGPKMGDMPITLALSTSHCSEESILARRSIVVAFLERRIPGRETDDNYKARVFPLHQAVTFDCFDNSLAQSLIENGYSVDATKLSEFGPETPLGLAVARGKASAVQFLLENDAKVDREGYQGQRPLYHHAKGILKSELRGAGFARGCSHNPDPVKIFQLLLEHDADPHYAPVGQPTIRQILLDKLNIKQCSGEKCYDLHNLNVQLGTEEWCFEYLLSLIEN